MLPGVIVAMNLLLVRGAVGLLILQVYANSLVQLVYRYLTARIMGVVNIQQGSTTSFTRHVGLYQGKIRRGCFYIHTRRLICLV